MGYDEGLGAKNRPKAGVDMRSRNIPQEIQSLDQWVCSSSDSKIPRRAFGNTPASSTDPSTWSSFETAINAVRSGRYDHVGFVFNDNGLVGVDIE